jgi:hypothetical protein
MYEQLSFLSCNSTFVKWYSVAFCPFGIVFEPLLSRISRLSLCGTGNNWVAISCALHSYFYLSDEDGKELGFGRLLSQSQWLVLSLIALSSCISSFILLHVRIYV